MILYQKPTDPLNNAKIVVLFGVGLIGTAVADAINTQFNSHSTYYPFAWNDTMASQHDVENINKGLLEVLKNNNFNDAKVDFIWCAGRVGFDANAADAEKELKSFKCVMSIVNKIHELNVAKQTSVHLLSSAGGLFEGLQLVVNNSVPQPKRHYGHLKLAQEKLLLEMDSSINKYIYRPTSVFGYIGPGQRMGLIPTLLANGLSNKVSTIYGNLSTLRDYVYNKDISHFIAQCIFGTRQCREVNYYLLASGKPSTIYEIKHCVERIINKKIYLRYYSTVETENNSDITLNSLAVPANWCPTDLNTGIKAVRDRMLTGLSYRLRRCG